MIVKSWREAFSTAMSESGDSWEMVEWKSMSDTWLDSRSWPEWDEVVMTKNYVYGTYYNSESSNVEESIIRAPRVPNIPFGLGMFVFEVWWECRTIDINKEM